MRQFEAVNYNHYIVNLGFIHDTFLRSSKNIIKQN